MSSTARKSRFHSPDPAAPQAPCESPGCARTGDFKAPKSPQNLREFRWFCLDHVRAYNSSWDFYKGMNADEIEAEMRADSSWQRPTWPLGKLGARSYATAGLEAEIAAFAFGGPPRPAPKPELPKELREALNVLGLTWPLDMPTLRTRYKELAKRHHPDMNHGDAHAVEKLKRINLAYATLRGKLTAQPQPD
jgi:hypothetical protein